MLFTVSSYRLLLFFLTIAGVVLLYYFALYETHYNPMAPFSLFNPKLRQSETPDLVGYINFSKIIDNDENVIHILIWTQVFGRDWKPSDWTPTKIENCDLTPQARCVITNDRKFLNRSAALMFHARDIVHTDLPSLKYRHQKYVFYSAESPVLTFAALQGASRNFFDWTMTYRTDSTIYCPYAYFEKLPSRSKFQNFIFPSSDDKMEKTLAEKRPKMVLWVVSNCDTHSKRERYVHELKKYVQVDVFGDCGVKCESNETYDCVKEALKEYKFYISFENAVCRDYVSEKFAYRMAANLVPIVLRRDDYDRVVPRDYRSEIENRSRYYFIAADDFNSPKDLADYLLFLDSHPKEYLKYFDWRQHYRIVASGGRYCLCDLCSKLYQDRERSRKIAQTGNRSDLDTLQNGDVSDLDIHQWWNVDTCDRNMALKLLAPNWRHSQNG